MDFASMARDYMQRTMPEGGINSFPTANLTPMPMANPMQGNLAGKISMAIPEAIRPVIAQELQNSASSLSSGIAGLIGNTFGTQSSAPQGQVMHGGGLLQLNPVVNGDFGMGGTNQPTSSLGSLGGLIGNRLQTLI